MNGGEKAQEQTFNTVADGQIEIWLRTDVCATYDAYIADASQTVPLHEAIARVRARAAELERLKPPPPPPSYPQTSTPHPR